jgi:hypothetical protein
MHAEHLFPRLPSPPDRRGLPTEALCLCPSSTVNPQPSIAPICSSSAAFVPQTTNVEKSPITNNIPGKLALKSQESYLFLEKSIFNFFLLKNHQSSINHQKSPPVPCLPCLLVYLSTLPGPGPSQPSILPSFHSSIIGLFLEKTKIQKTIEEQNFLPPYMYMFR